MHLAADSALLPQAVGYLPLVNYCTHGAATHAELRSGSNLLTPPRTAGLSANTRTRKGMTPLHMAAKAGAHRWFP